MEIKPVQYPLLSTWALWETFQSSYSQKKEAADDYKTKISKIFKFDSLDDFARLWNNLPHSKPAQFFYQKDKQTIKKVKHNNELRALESVSFFRKDIEPIWEDPDNKKGGEFNIKNEDMDNEDINTVWGDFVLYVIGEDFPYAARINGIRVVDKTKPPNLMTRFEIWVNFTDKDSVKDDMEKEVREYFDKMVTKRKGYQIEFKNH